MPLKIGNRSGIWPTILPSGRAWNVYPRHLVDSATCRTWSSVSAEAGCKVILLLGWSRRRETTPAGRSGPRADLRSHCPASDPVWVASYTDSATCKAVTPFVDCLTVVGNEDAAVREG